MEYKNVCNTDNLKKRISNRIINWCGDNKWLESKEVRRLRSRISNFYRYYGKKNLIKGLEGWEYAIGQILDTTDETICTVLPYLLTSYMYNYSFSLDSRFDSSYIKEFLDWKNMRMTYNYEDDGFFGVREDEKINELRRNLLNHDEDDNSSLERVSDFIANSFLLPEMTLAEWGLVFYVPETIKDLSNRDVNFSNFVDVFLTWYYVIRTEPIKPYKLNPIKSFVLFYQNFSQLDSSPYWGLQNEWETLFIKSKDFLDNPLSSDDAISREIDKFLLDKYFEIEDNRSYDKKCEENQTKRVSQLEELNVKFEKKNEGANDITFTPYELKLWAKRYKDFYSWDDDWEELRDYLINVLSKTVIRSDTIIATKKWIDYYNKNKYNNKLPDEENEDWIKTKENLFTALCNEENNFNDVLTIIGQWIISWYTYYNPSPTLVEDPEYEEDDDDDD